MDETARPGRAAGGRDARRSAPALKDRTYVAPRVRETLKRGLEVGFIQVQAPAGYGKTANIAQFLIDEGIDPRWYTCSPDDTDASHLVAGLISALGCDETMGGRTTLAALASRDVEQTYRALTAPILSELEHGTHDGDVLVIDDADLAASDSALQVLDYLLPALTPYVRIVLLSRSELALPSLTKRRIEGSIVRLDPDDLLLREDEIADCARSTFGIDIAAEEAELLYRVTSGWGIALRLAIHLRTLGGSLTTNETMPFTPEARSDLFSYLAAEILDHTDARIAAFLRRTAILSTLDPAICSRLTREAHTTEVIQSLARAGLPVMRAGWSTYRCHSLLREYFIDSMSDDERRSSHEEAAKAYADVGDWISALGHFVSANDINTALKVIDDHGRDLFYDGHGRALLEVVKDAPPALLAGHYHAEYWAAFAASRLLQLDWAAGAFERVHQAALDAEDSRMAQEALRALAHVLNGWGRYGPATEVVQRLLTTIPEDDVAGRAAITIGYLITGMGATSQFREAVDLVRKQLPDLVATPRPDAGAEAYARSVAAVTFALEGDFAAARAELNIADVLIAGREFDDITTYAPWSRALVEFMAMETEAAEQAARAAEDLALGCGDLQRVLECRAVLASVEVMRRNIDEADRAFADLDALRAGGADYWGIMLTLLSRPQRARMHGDLAGALTAAEANHALAVGLSGAWFICSTRLEVIDFRLLSGDIDAAEEHARKAVDEARALAAPLLSFGALLMLAAASPDDETEAMAGALALAEDHDYRFLLPYMVRLPQLDAALWRALGTEARGRAAILLRHAGSEAIGALNSALPSMDEPTALAAVEVLVAFGAAGRSALRSMASSSNRRIARAANDGLASLESANPYRLSRREGEVLRLLAEGLRTKDIAEQLVLTPATVSTHIQRIMTKTGTASRAELLALAARELTSQA